MPDYVLFLLKTVRNVHPIFLAFLHFLLKTAQNWQHS